MTNQSDRAPPKPAPIAGPIDFDPEMLRRDALIREEVPKPAPDAIRTAYAQKIANFSGNVFDDATEFDRKIYLKRADTLLALPVQLGAGERESVIAECAKASITPLTNEQKHNVENGFGALLRFEAIWNLAQKTSAAAIHALSRQASYSSSESAS